MANVNPVSSGIWALKPHTHKAIHDHDNQIFDRSANDMTHWNSFDLNRCYNRCYTQSIIALIVDRCGHKLPGRYGALEPEVL